MRTGFRVLGWILAVLAILLLARDLFVLAQSGAWAPIDVGPLWNALHPGSLQLAQPAIERHVHPYLWDPLLLDGAADPGVRGAGRAGGADSAAGRAPAGPAGAALRRLTAVAGAPSAGVAGCGAAHYVPRRVFQA